MFSTSLASCLKMRSAETSLCVSGAACVAAGAGVAGVAVSAAGTGAVSVVGAAVVAEAGAAGVAAAGAAGVAGAAGSDCATAVIPKPSVTIKKQKLKKERMLPPSP